MSASSFVIPLCPVQDGYMLYLIGHVNSNRREVCLKYTGYPYPETEKDSMSMLYDLLMLYGDIDYDYIVANYRLKKAILMDKLINKDGACGDDIKKSALWLYSLFSKGTESTESTDCTSLNEYASSNSSIRSDVLDTIIQYFLKNKYTGKGIVSILQSKLFKDLIKSVEEGLDEQEMKTLDDNFDLSFIDLYMSTLRGHSKVKPELGGVTLSAECIGIVCRYQRERLFCEEDDSDSSISVNIDCLSDDKVIITLGFDVLTDWVYVDLFKSRIIVEKLVYFNNMRSEIRRAYNIADNMFKYGNDFRAKFMNCLKESEKLIFDKNKYDSISDGLNTVCSVLNLSPNGAYRSCISLYSDYFESPVLSTGYVSHAHTNKTDRYYSVKIRFFLNKHRVSLLEHEDGSSNADSHELLYPSNEYIENNIGMFYIEYLLMSILSGVVEKPASEKICKCGIDFNRCSYEYDQETGILLLKYDTMLPVLSLVDDYMLMNDSSSDVSFSIEKGERASRGKVLGRSSIALTIYGEEDDDFRVSDNIDTVFVDYLDVKKMISCGINKISYHDVREALFMIAGLPPRVVSMYLAKELYCLHHEERCALFVKFTDTEDISSLEYILILSPYTFNLGKNDSKEVNTKVIPRILFSYDKPLLNVNKYARSHFLELLRESRQTEDINFFESRDKCSALLMLFKLWNLIGKKNILTARALRHNYTFNDSEYGILGSKGVEDKLIDSFKQSCYAYMGNINEFESGIPKFKEDFEEMCTSLVSELNIWNKRTKKYEDKWLGEDYQKKELVGLFVIIIPTRVGKVAPLVWLYMNFYYGLRYFSDDTIFYMYREIKYAFDSMNDDIEVI